MKRRSFDLLAPLYDLGVSIIAFFLGGEDRLRQTVTDALAPMKGRRVLDVFTGTGAIALRAASDGAHVVALDLSQGMLSVAQEKSRVKAVPIALVAADAALMPFADNTFDVVVASMGLHEITRDMATAAINESYRVLKHGGRLGIFDYHRLRAWQVFFMVYFLPLPRVRARGSGCSPTSSRGFLQPGSRDSIGSFSFEARCR